MQREEHPPRLLLAGTSRCRRERVVVMRDDQCSLRGVKRSRKQCLPREFSSMLLTLTSFHYRHDLVLRYRSCHMGTPSNELRGNVTSVHGPNRLLRSCRTDPTAFPARRVPHKNDCEFLPCNACTDLCCWVRSKLGLSTSDVGCSGLEALDGFGDHLVDDLLGRLDVVDDGSGLALCSDSESHLFSPSHTFFVYTTGPCGLTIRKGRSLGSSGSMLQGSTSGWPSNSSPLGSQG